MFILELADIRIKINNSYPFVEKQCKEYIVDKSDFAFEVTVSYDEILEEKKFGEFSDGYCESICVYRHICSTLPDYNIFLMHSSIICADGSAFAFAAKSGVGKSTHTALWLKNIPGSFVINGDKPLLKLEENGSITAFGTPWNGKENWGRKAKAPLKAICFLERGLENSIRNATENEIITKLIHQLYLRGTKASIDKQLFLMNALVKAVPFYVLACNISNEAALLSFQTMNQSGGNIDAH